MAELRPEHLEEMNSADEDNSKTTRPKQKELSSILDWVQAFGIYVAMLSRNQPQKVPSLLAYQHLIIHSHTHSQTSIGLHMTDSSDKRPQLTLK